MIDFNSFGVGILFGLVAGGLIIALWLRPKLVIAQAQLAAAEANNQRSGHVFQGMAEAALRSNQSAFLDAARSTLETVRAQMTGDLVQRQTAIDGVVRPLKDSLNQLQLQFREIESSRQRMFGGLEEQLGSLAKETVTLSNALRSPHIRGRWGEITLRRVAELAGMVKHCDFQEQSTQEGNDGRIRPDMIVRLPGGRTLVVDAKVPLTAYMEASAAVDDVTRKAALLKHCQQVSKHVEQLSSKQYWSSFQPSPELVVLFLPGDQFFSAAVEVNPSLIEESIGRKVLLATPITLISILKGISYGWRQEQLAENAEQIRQVAAEFYERLQTLQDYYSETGKHLERAVGAYNKSVASWETRLLPSLRKIRDLGAATGEEPEAPGSIQLKLREPKPLEAPQT